jgi:hypothetical protein
MPRSRRGRRLDPLECKRIAARNAFFITTEYGTCFCTIAIRKEGIMPFLILALVGALWSQELFAMRCDLQGTYDEIMNATMTSRTQADVDMFRGVFYEPEFEFIDAANQHHTGTLVREQGLRELHEASLTAMRLAIQSISLTPEGATAMIHVVTVRTLVDPEGLHGKPGKSHTFAEITLMRDTWIKHDSTWKLKMREQVGETKVLVDRMPPEIETPPCPTS